MPLWARDRVEMVQLTQLPIRTSLGSRAPKKMQGTAMPRSTAGAQFFTPRWRTRGYVKLPWL